MKPDFERLASDLAHAWCNGSTIPLPPAHLAPATRAEAYVIQDRMAELIAQPVVGWKVGSAVRAVQIFEGQDGPLPGRIFADRLFESPARVPARLFHAPKIECEFAFRLTAALPPGTDAITEAALAPHLIFHPSIEIAATRYAPGTGARAATSFDGIADNATSGGAVLGEAVTAWRDIPFETLPIDARIDDSPPIQAYSGPYRRHPLSIAAETFSSLRARGIALPVGTCLLTASLTLPTQIRAGQTLRVRFADFPPLSLAML